VPRTIGVKHASSKPSPADGVRVLVESRWPAGLRREEVAADLWLKDAAPSEVLRRWYAREPGRWNAFTTRYRAELRQRPELLRLLHELRRRGPLTLLHGMRDESRNYALVVRELLEKDNEP
jgi:uncharacterized protein YeaO (DUF488 family)